MVAASIGENTMTGPGKLAAVVCTAAIIATACASDHPSDHTDFTSIVKAADATVIRDWDESGLDYVVLDVRTEEEFRDDGRVPGSVLYPYSYNSKTEGVNEAFMENVTRDFDSEDRIVVLCSHGMRATQAAADLQGKANFSNVYVFPGGVEGHHMARYPAGDGWLAAELPFED